MKPSHLVAGLAVAAVVGAAAWRMSHDPFADGAHPLRIGVAGPLTGDQKEMGTSIANAVDLVVEEWNVRGGVGGRRVDVVKRDDQAMPDKAKQAALDLVAEGVVGVIGHFNTGCTIPASDEYRRKMIPMLTPASTNPTVTDRRYPNVFRLCGRDDVQGPMAATFAVERLGAKRVAVLHDKTPYGKGLADAFRESVARLGAEVVYEDGFDDKEKVFRPYLTAIKEKSPDLYYFGGIYHQAGPLVLQARDLGISAAFMSGDGTIDQRFLQTAREAAEGAYLTFGPDFERFPAGKVFAEKYRARFGVAPGPYSFYAHDAAQVLLTALAQVGSDDPAALCEAIRNVSYTGLSGEPVVFDAKGDTVGSGYVMWTVRDGRFVVVADE